MIKEAYVSFETAKLLKEKGFDIPCGHYYEDNQVIIRSLLRGIWNEEEDLLSAPTHQMVLAYLREKDIYIDVFPHKIYERKKQFLYEIKDEHAFYQSEGFFKTYEEATEAAIKYSLENLI